MKLSRRIVALVTAAVFLAGAGLPPEARAISAAEEEKLGQEFMQLVFTRYRLVEDPFVQGYIDQLGRRIVAVLPSQPFDFSFFVIQEEVYNAFAAPAGHIFINSGLFAALDNEEELAGILAHEVAHSLCRHLSQNIERSKKLGMAALAGMVAGVLMGAAGAGGAAAQAVTMGTMAAGQSAQLAYSRENERQADEIGLEYLTRAGYGGMGLLTSLQKIRSKTVWGKNQVPTYLTTHPAAEDRMAYIDSWLQSRKAAGAGESAPVDSKSFHRARTRLLALYSDEDTALRHFQQAVAEHPDDPMILHGYGLVLGRLNRREEAIAQLQLALARQAFDPYVLKDLGRIYFLDGRYADALRALEGARSMGSEDPEAPFYYGRTLMELGRLEEARSVFEEVVDGYPAYDPALFYLGSVHGTLGDLADAHLTLGRYYSARRDFETARMHLEKALAQTADPLKRERIETLLREAGKKAKEERDLQRG